MTRCNMVHGAHVTGHTMLCEGLQYVCSSLRVRIAIRILYYLMLATIV